MNSWICLLAGLTLVASSLILSKLRPPDWTKADELGSTADVSLGRWTSFQSWVRRINNLLLAIIGVMVFSTGLIAQGQTWMILWLCILLLLMIVVLLACLDAFSSMTGYRRAVPEAARRSFGKQQNP